MRQHSAGPAPANRIKVGHEDPTLVVLARPTYRGYLPIETLASGRKDYNPLVDLPKMLASMRAEIAATESNPPKTK